MSERHPELVCSTPYSSVYSTLWLSSQYDICAVSPDCENILKYLTSVFGPEGFALIVPTWNTPARLEGGSVGVYPAKGSEPPDPLSPDPGSPEPPEDGFMLQSCSTDQKLVGLPDSS